VTFAALAGLTARDSDASAIAAVPARESLMRLEWGTTTWVGGISQPYATFCVSVEALPTLTRHLDSPLRNLNNGLLNQEGKLSNPFPTKPPPKPLHPTPKQEPGRDPGMGGTRTRDRRIGDFRNLDQKQQLRKTCLGHEPDEVDQSDQARLEQLQARLAKGTMA
jgi:hypothetical protein